MPQFHVSGVIQFTVTAKSEEEAMQKADARANTLMRQSPSVNIGLDEDAVEPVGLTDHLKQLGFSNGDPS